MAIETRREVRGDEPVEPVPMRVHPTAPASLGLLLLRLPVGAFFLLAGVMKFRMGVGNFVDSSLKSAQPYMSEHVGRMFLTALPYAEVALGALLILGLLTRFAGLVCTLLLISIMVSVTGVRQDQMPHPNVVLLGATLALMLCGPGRISLDGLFFRPRRTVVVTREYTEPM
jgi:uncharacterized membrane protein YphA (DoxX/SURF4 family)